jgi:ABC-type transport system substrate-binding protein
MIKKIILATWAMLAAFSAVGQVVAPSVAADEDAMQQAIMADDYETAYALGNQILERDPINLTALHWTLFAATEIGESYQTRSSLLSRYNSLIRTIALSGDGVTPETAFRVASEADMYTYTMLVLGLEVGEGWLWDGRVTEFEVSPAGPDARFNHPSIFFELQRP